MEYKSTASGTGAPRARPPKKPSVTGSRTSLSLRHGSRMHLDQSSVAGKSRTAISTISSGVFTRGSHSRIRASQSMLDRAGKATGGQEKAVQVLDEDGNDVTPLSLLGPHQAVQARKGQGASSATELGSQASVARETVADVLNNLESVTAGSWNASVFGRSAMMGMSFSSVSKMSGADTVDEDDHRSVASAESAEEHDDDDAAEAEPATKVLTETELQRPVQIVLTETATIPLLDIISVAMSNEFSDEASVVRAANAKYKEILDSRAANENFVDRAMQTFNEPLKTKEIQAAGAKQANAECMATQWSIYDAYHGEGAVGGDDAGGRDGELEGLSGQSNTSGAIGVAGQGSVGESALLHQSTIASSSMVMTDPMANMSRSVFLPDGETMSDVYASVGMGTRMSVGPDMLTGGQGTASANDVAAAEVITINALNQENLRNSLTIMERAVVANNFEKRLIQYRDVVDAEEAEQKRIIAKNEAIAEGMSDLAELRAEEALAAGEKAKEDKRDVDSIPTVDFLWSYRCELTRGRPVTFLAWNKDNEDILAVAYGEQKPGPNPFAGLVLCWSVKNPEWPERIYRTKSTVTAIDFSRSNPNLLACGYMDGRIAIYDVRRKGDKPVLDNSDLGGKHRDPIWELRWVDRERGDEQARGETLVSVSTDGRVVQWLIRKGLEYADLMSLKRVTKQQETKAGMPAATTASKPGSFIARQSGGLCFDFNPKDSNIYMVGTDDGHIHRCSCSYNEQYLTTYFGHTGPVNRIRWSPFASGIFLSCSSDWTVRLWNQENEESLLKFQSGKDTITDLAWSPASPTIFGCVSTDGRMEIWDLQFSVLDPAILHTVLDRQLTSIVFASKSPVVLTGDDTGAVNVYKLKKLNMVPDAQAVESIFGSQAHHPNAT
ncbi:WD40-repeat-containing domain protein [Phlyctochytrium arcticum]|nr:WD40-repeat-containing domain protein [Phlyctochytrium arcticum]